MISHMNNAIKHFKGKRQFGEDVIDKEWDSWQEADFERVSECGYRLESYVKPWIDQKQIYTSLFFLAVQLPEAELAERVKKLFSEKEYGKVYRVKGSWQNPDGKWRALNATEREFHIEEIEKGQHILIVIGEGLEKEKLQNYFS